MNDVIATATSELSMLKSGQIKRVLAFDNLMDAGKLETGKKYRLIEEGAEIPIDRALTADKTYNLGVQKMQEGLNLLATYKLMVSVAVKTPEVPEHPLLDGVDRREDGMNEARGIVQEREKPEGGEE